VGNWFDKTILNYVILRDIRTHTTAYIEGFRLMMVSSATSCRLVGLLRDDGLTDLITH
jgi:hypothetical protein